MEIRKWACLDADLSVAAEVVDTVKGYDKNLGREHCQAIYSTITELVANIRQHAYPYNFKSTNDFACEIVARQVSDGSIVIAVEDFGVTIPQSIINKISKHHNSAIELHDQGDHDIIAGAVISGEKTTLNEGRGRGQGLNSIFNFIGKGVFQSIKISSRCGSLYCTMEKNELSVNFPSRNGTLIEIITPAGMPLAILQHGEIDVAKEFGKYPAGRFSSDGIFSAELFMSSLLIPAFEKYQTITVDLDGTYGYGASFLEEAFGGLVRRGHSASSLRGRLNLISNEDFHLPHQIWTYIDEADRE